MKEQQESKPKKPNILVRLIALLVTAALLLGALVLVVYRDQLNLDALARWFEYRDLETSESGEAVPFSHAGGDQVSFAYLENGVLMSSYSGARYYSFSGELYAEEVRNFEHPVLTHSDSCGVVYDAGGQDLYLFRGVEEAFHLTLDGGGELLSARVNDSGWLAVTSHGGGYRGSVAVYNSTYNAQEPQIQINLSTTFIVDAAASPDGQTVAIVTMGQEGGSFQSQIRFYPIDQKEPSAVVSLGNTVVLELDYEDGQLWVLGEEQVSMIQEDGTVVGTYSLGRNYLKGCSFGGDGFALLLLGRYRAGSADQVVVLGPDGVEQVSQTLSSNVLAFDAAGRYVALLTGEELNIYTSDFTPYGTLDHTQNARYTSLTDSGAALLANSQQAWLYLPS